MPTIEGEAPMSDMYAPAPKSRSQIIRDIRTSDRTYLLP